MLMTIPPVRYINLDGWSGTRSFKIENNMKCTIWKFALKPLSEQSIEMPENAQIISIQMQASLPYIWAIVNPVNQKKKRVFHTFGTGTVIPEADRNYIGTYKSQDDVLVFHVFELI